MSNGLGSIDDIETGKAFSFLFLVAAVKHLPRLSGLIVALSSYGSLLHFLALETGRDLPSRDVGRGRCGARVYGGVVH